MDEGEVYEIWTDRIIKRFEKGDFGGKKGIQEHIIHHAIELEGRDTIPLEWQASMATLVDMAKRLLGYDIQMTINRFGNEDINNVQQLQERIIKHAIELRKKKIDLEWIMTIMVLLNMAITLTGCDITKRFQLERLYIHWKEDMTHMEPPPFEICFLEKKKAYISPEWRSGDS